MTSPRCRWGPAALPAEARRFLTGLHELRVGVQTGGRRDPVGVRKASAPLMSILNNGITRQCPDTETARPVVAPPSPQAIQLTQLLTLNERQTQLLAERSVWGIGAEHPSSVFEPFGGAPTLPGSSGLGLSICRRVV